MPNKEQIITEARNLANAAAQLNSIKGLKEDPALPNELQADELVAFNRTFGKSLRQAYQTNDFQLGGIFARHKIDIMLALLIAKKQVEGVFGGTDDPQSAIGVSYNWEPAFWGVDGDDWRGARSATAGSAQNFVHSGTTILGGSASQDVQFKQNVVFVLLGYANYSQDYPRITKLQERIDTAPQPVLNVGSVWKNAHADYAVKYFELDTPRILARDTKFRLQTFAEATVPASEWLYPIGAMFTKQNLLLEFDMGAKDADFLNDHDIIVKTS